MINVLNNLMKILGIAFSYIFPHKLFNWLRWRVSAFYSGWRMREFRNIPLSSHIDFNAFIRGGQYISMGKCCLLNENVAITCMPLLKEKEPSLEIGDHCCFGKRNHITCINRIVIGNNLLTGNDVLISDNSHGNPHDKEELKMAPNARPVCSSGEVIIGNNVWIGSNATILPGVHIGDGAVIGANTVVTKDVPSYAVCVGSSSRIFI